jgi:hypothetical protein
MTEDQNGYRPNAIAATLVYLDAQVAQARASMLEAKNRDCDIEDYCDRRNWLTSIGRVRTDIRAILQGYRGGEPE